LLKDLARFLGVTHATVMLTAQRLRLLRKPEGDRWYAPLTRAEAKRLIQECRAKHHGP
jgi:hypothetical protein